MKDHRMEHVERRSALVVALVLPALIAAAPAAASPTAVGADTASRGSQSVSAPAARPRRIP